MENALDSKLRYGLVPYLDLKKHILAASSA